MLVPLQGTTQLTDPIGKSYDTMHEDYTFLTYGQDYRSSVSSDELLGSETGQ